ncbi:MAG: pyridoxal-phosphate dependent enzyme [Acidobacteriota bacterium]|nr:pyridoxal-phosphate dependent enzyme [Acidobacteriota bacterium]
MKSAKFHLQCLFCQARTDSFQAWFRHGQQCPKCGGGQADVIYPRNGRTLQKILHNHTVAMPGLWRYIDVLPINDKRNIVSAGEGVVPIDRWRFFERTAKEVFGIRCRVYAHRHDNNYATGTFKDLAGSVVASVLKESGIPDYVVASTGNVGVAYARYLAGAGTTLYAFIPRNSSVTQEAEISCFGQKAFRVDGDYQKAKEFAASFAAEHGMVLAAGNFDPMRIEAKKTMAYEWLRLMPEFPTVYIQALSGGTGPLAVAKAFREFDAAGLSLTLPRFLLVQSDKCPPMAEAWKKAKAQGFPEGWERNYPIYHNPRTSIPTLATGYPKTYPVLAPLVRRSGGEILAFSEKGALAVTRLTAFESAVRMGPAAAVAVGGFLKTLASGLIRNGDVVLLNIGEGIRRAPEFMKRLVAASSPVASLDACPLMDRKAYEKELWENVSRFL